jgi:hypothetical protein
VAVGRQSGIRKYRDYELEVDAAAADQIQQGIHERQCYILQEACCNLRLIPPLKNI